jgi:hypothetical protein
MKSIFLKTNLLLLVLHVFAQAGGIKGRVYNAINNEALPFSVVEIKEKSIAVECDSSGNYSITDLTPGLYNLTVRVDAFKTKTIYEVKVGNIAPALVDFAMEEDVRELDAVTISSSKFAKTDETPLSIRTLSANEIERYPGGNRDISRVIQSLPGVASTASFRNDIIIRGGAPNENKFYIDEIETPVINHFATQGSSGGPVGIINVNLIKDVDVISGAFPANRFNTASSVFDFKLKEGRKDRYATQMTIGASEFTVSNEGPIGKKTTYIASIRRSYLQNLFKLIGLPFLPTFNDYLVKTKTKFNDKNEFTFVSLGAYDVFKLDRSAIDKATDPETKEQRQYIWENVPVNNQWNYMIGGNYRHYRKNGYYTFILSRNMLNNESTKYKLNDDTDPSNLNLNYTSQESENKFRAERYLKHRKYFFRFGVNYEYSRYYNSTYNKRVSPDNQVYVIDFKSKTLFNTYGAFVQVNRSYFADKLSTSAGVRIDASDFSASASNPFNQISPRFSLSYYLSEKFSFNANTGIYYQKPAYTVLGFRNTAGELVNRSNNVQYIQCKHLVAGFEYRTNFNAKFTMEGFYKLYNNYPASVVNRVSLANLGADFGAIGNEAVLSTSKGRSYGMEFLLQQKLNKGFYGIMAVTIVRSEFTNNGNSYLPSSWDNKFILSFTAGKKFKKNWELGGRWRLLGGQPYTPYDLALSSQKSNWDIYAQALPNYNQVNSNRLAPFHQLDIRLDKKYYFKRWNLDWYIDIQNAYNFKSQNQPYLLLQRDANGQPITDPNNSSAYLLKEIPNTSGQLLPTVGVIVEF